jgi:Abortive infection alpha
LKRALRIGEKTRKLLERHGLTPQRVPHRTAVPLLEAASLEDDEGLQDRWAALLANAAAQTMEVPPSFATVLRDLDPAAARVLDAVYMHNMEIAINIQAHFAMKTERMSAELGISPDRASTSSGPDGRGR